ncbi:MAG: polysaccharide deacetylase family protein [Bacteroidota bacterium]
MSKALFISVLFLLLLLLAMRWYGRKADRDLFITCISDFSTKEKVIALTFDDGPSPQITPRLLQLLADHQVQATFFVNGIHLEMHPEIARDAIAQGHQLANHSYAHDRMVFKSPSFIRQDLQKTDSLLNALGQKNLHFFRPPFGDSFLVLPLVIRQLGKVIVGWSAEAPAQYNKTLNPTVLVKETLDQCRPGAIILLHDGWSPAPDKFLEAVRQIIESLQQKGYTFVTLQKVYASPIE